MLDPLRQGQPLNMFGVMQKLEKSKNGEPKGDAEDDI